MRIFNHYRKELQLTSSIKKGAKGANAEKIQQWINFNYNLLNFPPKVTIDMDFGNATEASVINFQRNKNITANGVVDNSTFYEMTKPLKNAFDIQGVVYNNFRELICKIAQIHVDNKPLEFNYLKNKVNQSNRGPWVRSYCNSEEGVAWCVGFLRTVFDQACDIANQDFKKIMPITLGCDEVAEFAIAKGRLIKNNVLNERFNEIKPGDIFFKFTPDHGEKWHHIGIIIEVHNNGIVTTIEGNSDGSVIMGNIGDTSDGTGVYKKMRNLFDNKILNDENGIKYRDYYEVYSINY
jgi:hypothetical protein